MLKLAKSTLFRQLAVPPTVMLFPNSQPKHLDSLHVLSHSLNPCYIVAYEWPDHPNCAVDDVSSLFIQFMCLEGRSIIMTIIDLHGILQTCDPL